MAYAFTNTVTKMGPGKWELLIEETDAAATSEAAITEGDIPPHGVVTRQECQLDSGTGTTVDPVLGVVTNPAGDDVTVANDSAASSVSNLQSGGAPFLCRSASNLFHRSNPDAGTDNVITTRYTIVDSRRSV